MKRLKRSLVALLCTSALIGGAEAQPMSYILTKAGGTITLHDEEGACGVGWFVAEQNKTPGCWTALDGEHIVVLWDMPQKIIVPIAYESAHFRPVRMN